MKTRRNQAKFDAYTELGSLPEGSHTVYVVQEYSAPDRKGASPRWSDRDYLPYFSDLEQAQDYADEARQDVVDDARYKWERAHGLDRPHASNGHVLYSDPVGLTKGNLQQAIKRLEEAHRRAFSDDVQVPEFEEPELPKFRVVKRTITRTDEVVEAG